MQRNPQCGVNTLYQDSSPAFTFVPLWKVDSCLGEFSSDSWFFQCSLRTLIYEHKILEKKSNKLNMDVSIKIDLYPKCKGNTLHQDSSPAFTSFVRLWKVDSCFGELSSDSWYFQCSLRNLMYEHKILEKKSNKFKHGKINTN